MYSEKVHCSLQYTLFLHSEKTLIYRYILLIYFVYLQTKTFDMKRAVIYARVSSTNDRQSTDRQVADLTAYAAQNDYEIAEVYEEHVSGAKKNDERPILCECLSFCVENDIDIILTSELSRLGRNVDEVLANVRFCKDHHIDIFFQKEQITIFQADGTENPFATIMVAVLGTCAQLEREAIKFRLNSGRARYIENGGVVGRPTGTKKSPERLAKDYPQVVRELKRGTSVRRTAKLCDVSAFTVQKVKKALSL